LSGPSSVAGTIDENGNIKIPKDSFKMPVLDASTIAQSLIGIELPVEISAFMGVEQPATGTFDRDTGRMVIQTKAGIWVSINIQQLLGALDGLGIDISGQLGALGPLVGLLGQNLTCGFSPMDVTFTTETTSLGSGERFTKGLEGPGALTGEWSQLGPFAGKTKILGLIDACTTIRGLLPGLISGIGGGTGGIDLGGLNLGELLNGLDTLDLGPSALTLTRTVDTSPPVARPARLQLRVKARTTNSKRANSYRATVRNAGGSTARRVRVCAVAPRRWVKGARCRSAGSLKAGSRKTVSFSLRLAPRAPRNKYRVSFVLRAPGAKAKVTRAWVSKRR
jgi:hypothetical protein